MNPIRQENLLARAFAKQIMSVNTSVPAHFLVWSDEKLQRAQIQIGIEQVLNNGFTQPIAPIWDVPVVYYGGQFCIEHELNTGDEGILFFSQRAISAWKNTGGIAENPVARFFDVSDAYFMAGIRSMPNALPDFKNNGIRLRSKDGSQMVWLKNDGSLEMRNGSGFVVVGADGVVDINGMTVDTSGNVETPTTMKAKTVTGTEDVIFGNISGKNHRHDGVESGIEISGTPV